MSDVGKFLRSKLAEARIPLINIVRREEQLEQLKQAGFPLSLDSTTQSFERDLKRMAHEIDARVAFDAVAGEMTGKLFNRLPAKSTVYVYGSLSLKMVQDINPVDLIFSQKQIKGLHLVHNFLKGRSLKEFNRELVEDHAKGLLKTKYQKTIGLDELNNEISGYMRETGKGKLLIKLN